MSKITIGKAKYGDTKRNYWKLKDGEATFRILPPMGDLAESGRWSMYWSIHYGYKNSEGKMRVFQSPLVFNRKTKMVEQPDAAEERIKKLKAEFELAKKAGDKEKIEKLEKLVGKKGQFNLDKHHYMNVMDEQGNIGVLKIRHKCKQSLDAEIKRLRESEGVDPLSVDNGRFFVFSRSGTGLETNFSVRTKSEKIKVENVGTVNKDIVHVLTDDILNRLGTEAAELDKLFKKPTSEEVAKIVKEGPRAVDEIFGSKENTEDDAGADYEDEESETPKEASSTANSNGSTTAPSTVGYTYSTSSKTSAQTISEMSVEDFLASLETK